MAGMQCLSLMLAAPLFAIASQSAGNDVWTSCTPCAIRSPEHGGANELEIDIWNQGMEGIRTPRPVVLAFHGNNGNVRDMKPQCKLFNGAGFVCASVAPQSTRDEPSIYVEGAITYLRDNRITYNIDQDKIFLYGYSGGGHTMLRYMMYTEQYELRSHVRGMISDASSPGSSEFNWQKEVDGKPLYFPPYLMLHCTEDNVMKPMWSVRKSVVSIDRANQRRNDEDKLLHKWVKFTEASQCNHNSLVLSFGMGEDSAVVFIENIVQAADSDYQYHLTGDDPFLGLPDIVDDNGARLRCSDVQPPQHWKENTCEKQLTNTNNCAARRDGTRNDGYCRETCGVCAATTTAATTTTTTSATTAATTATTTAATTSATTSSTPCTDVQPPARWNENTCEKQLVNTNNCAERRDGTRDDGYCHKTCGVCGVPPTTTTTTTPCTDVQPPARWQENTCEKQLMNTNNCAERRDGTRNDGYCHETCGVCGASSTPTTTAAHTSAPTAVPTKVPTIAPTVAPTFAVPTVSPTLPPTVAPTLAPTVIPTPAPTTSAPTIAPTMAPTASTPCTDVQPPARWKNNTCQKQLMNTNRCQHRRDGTRNDGYCHKTCGVCSVAEDR